MCYDGGMAMQTDQRLTQLQQTRRAWDQIIAAHYYYQRKMGYGTIADLFQMPKSTVRKIIKRTPEHDPGVRMAAIRFGLISEVIR